jgi:hypothetical protein
MVAMLTSWLAERVLSWLIGLTPPTGWFHADCAAPGTASSAANASTTAPARTIKPR